MESFGQRLEYAYPTSGICAELKIKKKGKKLSFIIRSIIGGTSDIEKNRDICSIDRYSVATRCISKNAERSSNYQFLKTRTKYIPNSSNCHVHHVT